MLSPTYKISKKVEELIRQTNYFETKTYLVAGGEVLVHNLNGHVVADIFDINVEKLVPLGQFASTLESLCPDLLLASLKDTVRVHLAESLSVSCEFGLDNLESQSS